MAEVHWQTLTKLLKGTGWLVRFLKLQHCLLRLWAFLRTWKKKKITAGRKLCKSGLIRENTVKVGSQKWKRLLLILVWKAHKEGISKSNNSCQGNGQLAAAAILQETWEKVSRADLYTGRICSGFCIPASAAHSKLPVGFFRWTQRSKWACILFIYLFFFLIRGQMTVH